MRTSTLLLSMLLIATMLHAQEHLSHQLIVDFPMQVCDEVGTPGTKAEYRTPKSGSSFSICGSTSDHYIVRFWKWTEAERPEVQGISKWIRNEDRLTQRTETAKALNNKFRTDTTKDKELFFLIRKGDLATYAVPLYSRFSPFAGASVLPFKLRPQTGEFTKDLTLTGLGGIKWRPKRKDSFSVGALFGVGVTSVSLDSLNTEGRVLEPSDRAAITLSTGLVMQWERLQVGVFMGWDHLNKADRKLWVHQGAHWLAVGIGVSIFSEESEVKKEEN